MIAPRAVRRRRAQQRGWFPYGRRIRRLREHQAATAAFGGHSCAVWTDPATA